MVTTSVTAAEYLGATAGGRELQISSNAGRKGLHDLFGRPQARPKGLFLGGKTPILCQRDTVFGVTLYRRLFPWLSVKSAV